MHDAIYIVFLFALGSCVGSFLNVVVWRLPRVEPVEGEGLVRGFFRSMQALSEPPSHCPKCNKTLKWYDNVPVLGWIKLGGKCRFCQAPISKRYPIIEAITGLMFVGYYLAFFIYQIGPCTGIRPDGRIIPGYLTLAMHGWIYGLDMVLLSGLLAASLIDAELFIIPIEIPWVIVPIAVAAHGLFEHPGSPQATSVGSASAALAVGATIGLIISIALLSAGIMTASFADGAPLLEIERQKKENARASGKKVEDEPREWSPREVRREIRREMRFLFPPLLLGMIAVLLVWKIGPIGRWWEWAVDHHWVAASLGSILGGLAGGFTVWLTRILGSFGFGREAMGMGDVDLMVAVGCVLGAGPAVVAFFLAPFFGILLAIWMLFTGKKRELPYGPYLSLATAFVMLFYCPIAAYFAPGIAQGMFLLQRLLAFGT